MELLDTFADDNASQTECVVLAHISIALIQYNRYLHSGDLFNVNFTVALGYTLSIQLCQCDYQKWFVLFGASINI